MHPTAEQLLTRAIEKSGLTPAGDESFHEGLGYIAAALDGPSVTPGGRSMLSNEIVNYLANRLQVDQHHGTHPELAAESIDSPVVILGLPRTGTTVLSYLLDCSPDVRSLLNWEAVMSVPPPTAATLTTDARCLEMLEFQKAVFPAIDPPPPHWEWADGPTECTFVLAQDCKSVMWDARLPSVEHRAWIDSCDMTSAYAQHRRTLQLLQSAAPGQWVLKMPAHAYFIDALLATYPDARIVWTHRDPYKSVASFLDLMGFSQRLSLGEPDRDWIVETFPPRLAEYIRRTEAAVSGREVLHVHYDELVGEPVDAARTVLDWIGLPADEATDAAMAAWIAADPIRRPRNAPYSLADWELDRGELDALFGDYASTYGVTVS